MTKRFVIHPGFVVSKSSGQREYVGAVQLMRLYGIDPRDCIVVEPTDGQRRYAEEQGIKLLHLKPQDDGVYSIRREAQHRSPQ